MKTKLEILEETAQFYNSENRGYDNELGSCQYLTPCGNRCAVGRCINDDLIEVFQMDNESVSVSPEIWYKFQGKFKPEYEGHDADFWKHLQEFHDANYYWDANGLSAQGQIQYNALIARYTEK